MKQVTEEREGSIILPENRVLKFEMGEVLATGDGTYRDGTKREMWVKPGDVVLYQLGGPQIENSKFKLDGTPIKIFHQGDVIARLTGKKINKETFQIIGNWVLLEVEVEQHLIIVPKQMAPAEDFKFVVRQVGQGVNLPIKIGQYVYPERGKCLPVEVDGTTFVYTHQDFLHGALAEVVVSDPVIEDAVPSPTDTAP
ncbi:MAG: co-chaperone GroES [Azonexus sp.]